MVCGDRSLESESVVSGPGFSLDWEQPIQNSPKDRRVGIIGI